MPSSISSSKAGLKACATEQKAASLGTNRPRVAQTFRSASGVSQTFRSASGASALLHAKVLVALVAILVAGLEVWANHPLKQYSATYRRVSRQYAEAVRARPSRAGAPVSVLIVGNSLLLDGVDVRRLQKSAARLRIFPIFLESTGYYDWLYALRRLFRQGARPDVVIVGLGPESILENAVRQEYSPMILLDEGDVLAAGLAVGLDRTALSNLVFAHWSTFWNMRRVIRAHILGRTVPYFDEFVTRTRPRRPLPALAEFEEIVTERLQALRQLGEDNGARLIVLIPPTPASIQAIRDMAKLAKTAGVETMVPVDPATLPSRYYEPDAIHLNADGAQVFTSALVADLPRTLGVVADHTSQN